MYINPAIPLIDFFYVAKIDHILVIRVVILYFFSQMLVIRLTISVFKTSLLGYKIIHV